MSIRHGDPLQKKTVYSAEPTRNTARIVVLTGAGISAESGISTFRDVNGLWEQNRIEDVASSRGYAANPDMVHRFYDARRVQLDQVRPNAAHMALARLEALLPGEVLVVTQNVDDLHERAGSRKVVHMHGELRSALCTACGQRNEHRGALGVRPPCANCGKQALRPDIVWFGEQIREGDRIYEAIENCEILVVVGTSGHVQPAASFAGVAKANGSKTILIDLEAEAEARAGLYDLVIGGRASESVPAWVREFLLGEGALSFDIVEALISKYVETGNHQWWGDVEAYPSGCVVHLLKHLSVEAQLNHPAMKELDFMVRIIRRGAHGAISEPSLRIHIEEYRTRFAERTAGMRTLNIEYAADLIAWMAVDQARGIHRR